MHEYLKTTSDNHCLARWRYQLYAFYFRWYMHVGCSFVSALRAQLFRPFSLFSAFGCNGSNTSCLFGWLVCCWLLVVTVVTHFLFGTK